MGKTSYITSNSTGFMCSIVALQVTLVLTQIIFTTTKYSLLAQNNFLHGIADILVPASLLSSPIILCPAQFVIWVKHLAFTLN